jgi:hypothetical protein
MSVGQREVKTLRIHELCMPSTRMTPAGPEVRLGPRCLLTNHARARLRQWVRICCHLGYDLASSFSPSHHRAALSHYAAY